MPDTAPAPKKRGAATPEGKARSAQNALRHGLRAQTFALLPEEDQAEWGRHLEELRQGYAPVDAVELKLVEAIAAAMWNEIRADRTLAEIMVAIPPLAEGRPHGGDLQEPRHAALSLNTAIRYLTAASMATQRAQRAFLAHRKAKRDGLIEPQPQASTDAANENCTNEKRPASAKCTNEMAALRAWLDRLLDGPGAADGGGPGPGRRHPGAEAARCCTLPRPDRARSAGAGAIGLGFDAAGMA